MISTSQSSKHTRPCVTNSAENLNTNSTSRKPAGLIRLLSARLVCSAASIGLENDDRDQGSFFKGLLWALVLSIPLYALIALAFWVM